MSGFLKQLGFAAVEAIAGLVTFGDPEPPRRAEPTPKAKPRNKPSWRYANEAELRRAVVLDPTLAPKAKAKRRRMIRH